MDVDSVMNTYNMMSLWNNLNQPGASSSSVPLVSDLNSSVQEDYMKDNCMGENTTSELQDIYDQVEPNYDTGLTYDSSGNLTIPNNITVPTSGLSTENPNIISLLQGGESSSDLSSMNILNNYDALESGIYQSSYSKVYGNSDSSNSSPITSGTNQQNGGDLGITVNSSGDITVPTIPSGELSTENPDIISLLQGGESSPDLASMNLLNNYDALESGIYQSSYLKLYGNSDSSTSYTNQQNGSNLDATV